MERLRGILQRKVGESWRARAACKGIGFDEVFFLADDDHKDRGGKLTKMLPGRAYCMECAVRTECLAYSMQNRIDYGVWGGLDASERRHLAWELPEFPDLLG